MSLILLLWISRNYLMGLGIEPLISPAPLRKSMPDPSTSTVYNPLYITIIFPEPTGIYPIKGGRSDKEEQNEHNQQAGYILNPAEAPFEKGAIFSVR